MNCKEFLEILIAILLPPLGVFFKYGCCSSQFVICIALTILGYVPGIIYALFVIVCKKNDEEQDRDFTSDYTTPLTVA